MNADAVTDLCRFALTSALVMATPMLVSAMLAGLVIGLAQALTQVQDQTVSFVPKLIVMSAVMLVCFPWLVSRMVEFTRSVFLSAGIP
jgi:flagellar biosynthetic protein FliQ